MLYCMRGNGHSGARPIGDDFTSGERERFRNLLRLAAESPFEGERGNALAAATRMAERRGMTLEEPAGAAESRETTPGGEGGAAAWEAASLGRFAHALHLMDHYMQRDKARRAAALDEARRRGLDAEERNKQTPSLNARSSSGRRMDPVKHAAVLLQDTSLPFHEVAAITGLDIYEVVGLKLKLRAA